MKKIFLAVLIVSALIPASLAMTVNAPGETFTVPIGTSREIDISVTSAAADTITANIIDSTLWSSLGSSQVRFAAGETKTFKVFITPLDDTLVGLYKISVLFESLGTGELKKAEIFAYIDRADQLTMERVGVTGDLQPLGTTNVTVKIKNLKSVTVQGATLHVQVSSPSAVIDTEDFALPRLDPQQEYVYSETLQLQEYAEAGTYTVLADTVFINETSGLRQTFFVEPKAIILKEESRSSILFGYAKTINLTNKGNVPGDVQFTDQLSRFDSFFFSGAATTMSDYGPVWDETGIAPGESRLIHYNIDYMPLFAFIFAVALFVWVFFTKFRTVRVKKYIMQKKYIVEGEEFTVAVEVTNSTGRVIDAAVQDFVPAVFAVKEAQGVKPIKRKSQIGCELEWSAKALKKGESRIFTYKIVPIFGVRGTIKLPKASAIFKSGKHTWESKSLVPAIGVSEVPAEEQLWKKFFPARAKK